MIHSRQRSQVTISTSSGSAPCLESSEMRIQYKPGRRPIYPAQCRPSVPGRVESTPVWPSSTHHITSRHITSGFSCSIQCALFQASSLRCPTWRQRRLELPRTCYGPLDTLLSCSIPSRMTKTVDEMPPNAGTTTLPPIALVRLSKRSVVSALRGVLPRPPTP